MRRITVVAVITALVMGVLALPAVAKKPIEFTDSASFPDVNACTGAEHVVNQDFVVRINENRGTTVAHVTSTINTSDGWFGRGVENNVTNANLFKASLNIRVSDGNGHFFTVKGQLRIDPSTGDVVSDTLRVECGRAPA